MSQAKSLQRFIDAQKNEYAIALSEIKAGRKRSHWMWYIFPQIHGLGISSMAHHYAMSGLAEAEQYLLDPLLGPRLVEISTALLQLKSVDVHQIFGTPDDMKLRSSMTLFASVPSADPVFQQVLDQYFGGKADERTLRILGGR
jgi:uncharacterized protein (DUF1810 family)